MKRNLMMLGLAYALGLGTVLVVGPKSSSVPVCEIQCQPSKTMSDIGSRDREIFHSLEADPFRITSGEADGRRVAIDAIGFSMSSLQSALWVNNEMLDGPNSTDLLPGAYDRDAYILDLQRQFHGTLIDDVIR